MSKLYSIPPLRNLPMTMKLTVTTMHDPSVEIVTEMIHATEIEIVSAVTAAVSTREVEPPMTT